MGKQISSFVIGWWHFCMLLNVIPGAYTNVCSSWPGAKYFDGRCYYVANTTLTYDKAKTSCEQMQKVNGTKLAEPRTDQQYGFLKNMAKNLSLLTRYGTGVLMGGARDGNTETFRWPNGDEIRRWWASTKPDNFEFVEDCLEMRLEYNFALNDVSCDRANYYACEQYIGDPCDAFLVGSEYFHGHCFKLYDEIKTWNDSIATCENEDSYLAEPRDFPALQFLLSLIKITPGQSKDDSYFLGATDEKTDGTFQWLTTGELVTLDYWGSGEPSNTGSIYKEDHLTIMARTMKFNDASNDMRAKFFCQQKLVNHTYLIALPSKSLLLGAQLLIASSDQSSNNVYTVSQRVVNNDTCRTHKEMHSEVIAAFEPRKCIDLDPHLGMNSSDIFEQYVKIRSSHELTVVLSIPQDNSNSFSITATLVFNEAFFKQNYYLLSFPRSSGQLTVTALIDGTDIILKVPPSYRPDLVLGIGSVSLRQPGYATVTLDKYQTMVINTSDLRSGFIYATKAIIVYFFSETLVQAEVIYSDYMADMLIPVELMTSQYVTFPSWPLSDGLESYHLLALHDNTNVLIYGPQTQAVTLSESGDIQELTLPGSAFYFMKSDVPFQAKKMFLSSTAGRCVSLLLPLSLWRTEYVFITPPATLSRNGTQPQIINTISSVLFLISEFSPFDISFSGAQSCLYIEGTNLSGCYFEIPWGMEEPVYIRNNGRRFAAYAAWVKDNNRTLTCYPLGVDISNKYWESFDGLNNINFNETACTIETDTGLTTADNPTSSVYTTTTVQTDTMTTVQSDGMTTGPTNAMLTVQTDAATMVQTDAATTVQPHVMTTGQTDAVTMVHTDTMTTVQTDAMATGQTDAVTTVQKEDITTVLLNAMTTSWSSQMSTTFRVDNNGLLQQILRELEVNYKATSAFRRSKTSASDMRISSTMIGLSGITILSVFFVLFIFSDILSVIKYWTSKCLGDNMRTHKEVGKIEPNVNY